MISGWTKTGRETIKTDELRRNHGTGRDGKGEVETGMEINVKKNVTEIGDIVPRGIPVS